MVHAAKVAAVTVLRFLSRLSLWFLPNWAKLFFFWPEGWEFYYGCERPTACTVAPKEWNFGHIVSIFVWPLRYHPWNDKHRKILRAYGAAPPPPDPFYEEIKARHGKTWRDMARHYVFEPLNKLWANFLGAWDMARRDKHFAHPPGRDPWSLPGRLRQHQDAAACKDRPFAAQPICNCNPF